jgi:hypothetical protein
MSGFIRRREVLIHSMLCIRLFGWGVWWRALNAQPGTTFLDVVFQVRS